MIIISIYILEKNNLAKYNLNYESPNPFLIIEITF